MSEFIERRSQTRIANWLAAGFASTIAGVGLAALVTVELRLGSVAFLFFWAFQVTAGVNASRRGKPQLVAFIVGVALSITVGFVALLWFLSQLTFTF
jgi:flagellar biosynthesis protein FliR